LEKLLTLLEYIIGELVQNKEEIKINEAISGKNVLYKVRVAEGELGKVIGKNGITATAIRGVMQAAALKDQLNVKVEFLD